MQPLHHYENMSEHEQIEYVKEQLYAFLIESDVFSKYGLKIYNKKFGLLVCCRNTVLLAIEFFEETVKEEDKEYGVPSIEFSVQDMEVHEMEDVVEEWLEKELASGLKEKFLLKEDRVEK